MTDAETIKALECCSNAEPCENCPYQKQCDETDLAEIALDLINRQKAEIERLVKILDDKCDRCIEKERTEAIKEFAERLKEHKYQSSDWSHGEHPFVVEESDIDNLVNEMVGDAE